MKPKITIIGAGIVGLASALKILEKNPDIDLTILEKEEKIAKHQTGNNSGVIHSSIYYKPGSLKALNCKKGYSMLIDFSNKHRIEYKLSGKIIVATKEEELPNLDKIFQNGIRNGLKGLSKLNRKELKEKEPYVEGIAGVFVPQTGYIDYMKVAEKYRDIILQKGGKIKFDQKVISIKNQKKGLEIITEKSSYYSDYLLSCAGLFSDKITKMTNPNEKFRIIPFRGEYYQLKTEYKKLVKTLVYPVPNPAFPFLGIHFTNTIKGNVEAGPNAVLSFAREGYTKTAFNFKEIISTLSYPSFIKVMMKYWRVGLMEFYRSYNKKAFVKEIKKLIPEIKSEHLTKGKAGVRAQACNNDGLVDDFYFAEDEKVLHICNAPSPAATSSLAIGEEVAQKILSKIP